VLVNKNTHFMNHPYKAETNCCPRFNPEPWEGKEVQWEKKLFIKDKIRCLFHVPVNFGGVMVRNMALLDKAGAFTPEPPIVLSDHTSAWNMDLYIEGTKEVPGAEMSRISGTFLAKVFEGPFKDTKKWCQQMQEWVRSKGKAIKRELMYYTTCPKCAKHYGKNYVVIFAEV
jgi:hypothetical protein